MKYKIYRLLRNGIVIYIGRTTQSLKRRKANGYEYIPDYKECDMILIEETDDKTREQYWIDYYRGIGIELENKVDAVRSKSHKKEYYERNKEHLDKKRKQYLEKSKEERIEWRKNYRQKNKEKIKEYNRIYQLKLKEKLNESKKDGK